MSINFYLRNSRVCTACTSTHFMFPATESEKMYSVQQSEWSQEQWSRGWAFKPGLYLKTSSMCWEHDQVLYSWHVNALSLSLSLCLLLFYPSFGLFPPSPPGSLFNQICFTPSWFPAVDILFVFWKYQKYISWETISCSIETM